MLASMQTTDKALIGLTEALPLLGVSRDTAIRMIARGDLTAAYKMPGKSGAYLLDRAQVLRLAAEREQAKEAAS